MSRSIPSSLFSNSISPSVPLSPHPIVPDQAPATASPFLPRTNQVTSSSNDPPKVLKGPLIITDARNFEEYCRINNYKRLPAMYRPKAPGTERSTASTYFQWASARDLAQESVGYTRGLGFTKYKISYENGGGKTETFESVLIHRLGWNIDTFKASTRLFEAAEFLTMNFIWDPMLIPTTSTNRCGEFGAVNLDKGSAYEVWKGMVYLFYQPGFFKNRYEPLQNADKSEEEQIAAQVSQNNMHHHLHVIEDFLVCRITLKPLRTQRRH
ncbi:hypothetical protein C8J55DRAFT_567027 [Lentinula edodes]|uniref:Uncharacterized protein n=1 Tax=Lentinula lateritia TaxID=40482 RepID=A0A9W8ZQP6_9AGAR|nr:hypothetical protein C8J55DRAFT_567027 [Lentinula edodes]